MSMRVLYVDDDADIREVALLALSLDPKLDVKTCASGAEGIVAAAEWQPHLILLDVMMPGMDGPTTLAELRSRAESAHTPVVFITARAQSRELERYLSLGVAGVIAKPFDPMTLAAQAKMFMVSR